MRNYSNTKGYFILTMYEMLILIIEVCSSQIKIWWRKYPREEFTVRTSLFWHCVSIKNFFWKRVIEGQSRENQFFLKYLVIYENQIGPKWRFILNLF